MGTAEAEAGAGAGAGIITQFRILASGRWPACGCGIRSRCWAGNYGIPLCFLFWWLIVVRHVVAASRRLRRELKKCLSDVKKSK